MMITSLSLCRAPLQQAVTQVLKQMTRPLHLGEITHQVLQIYPSRARNPQDNVRRILRHRVRQVVPMGDGIWVPAEMVLNKVRFRCLPTAEEIDKGVILAPYHFGPFLPEDPQRVTFIIPARETVPTRVVSVNRYFPGFVLMGWFKRVHFQPGDSILITVMDLEKGCFQIEHEPQETRRPHHKYIQRRNQQFVEVLLGLLEQGRRQVWPVIEIIPQVYARLSGRHVYPGDHWMTVVNQDKRLRLLDNEAIARATYRRPLDALLYGVGSEATKAAAVDQDLEACIDKLMIEIDKSYSEAGLDSPALRNEGMNQPLGWLSPPYEDDYDDWDEWTCSGDPQENTDLLDDEGYSDDPYDQDEYKEYDEYEEVNQIYEESRQLIDRFLDRLEIRGLSLRTLEDKETALDLYAEYLASFYGIPIEQSHYDTLDDFLFNWYIRKVDFRSPTFTKQLLTALNQFFEFLVQEEIITDRTFMRYILARKNQLLRKMALYDQMDPNSPNWERMFNKLFGGFV